MKRLTSIVAAVGTLIALAGCHKTAPQPRVVLYCSVDEEFAKPIVKRLEERTGLRIDAIYDVEAAKTAGLANRIRAEQSRPGGDVFWSSALLQTLLLQRDGLLDAYTPVRASEIPAAFKDKGGQWTGMGVRMHTLCYRKGLQNPPKSLNDLLQPRFKNKIAISNPQFGTGADWLAATAASQGAPNTLDLLRKLKANGLRVLPGNSVVADGLDRGDIIAGLADGDDWAGKKNAVEANSPELTAALPVPGGVAILAGAPHIDEARRLVDALTDISTEQALAAEMPGVYSTRDAKRIGAWQKNYQAHISDPGALVKGWDSVREEAAQILLPPSQ